MNRIRCRPVSVVAHVRGAVTGDLLGPPRRPINTISTEFLLGHLPLDNGDDRRKHWEDDMTGKRFMARSVVVAASVVIGLAVSAGPAAADGTLTGDEKALLSLMDPSDRARYLLQKRTQDQAETAVLLSQLQSLRHQTALSAINNIR